MTYWTPLGSHPSINDRNLMPKWFHVVYLIALCLAILAILEEFKLAGGLFF